MLAGMCTFLNVYDTQPLLPYLQRLYHTSEIAVSFTVSATILAVALTAPFIGCWRNPSDARTSSFRRSTR